MRLPAYLLLPIGGAVLLLAAVLGTWLWPEPTVSLPSGPAPAAVAPVALEAPPPPPASSPLRLAPSSSVQPVLPPPNPVAMPAAPAPVPVAKPSEPAPAAPSAPVAVPAYSQFTNMTRDQQLEMKKRLSTVGQRASEVAERALHDLERQREEAHAQGNVAEVNRLDALLDSYRERMERSRQQRLELAPAQAGPPTQ